MGIDSISLSEALRKGVTPETLEENFRKSLAEAKAQLEAENSNIKKYRDEAAEAFVRYIVALDIIGNLDTDAQKEVLEEVKQTLISSEKAYGKNKRWVNMLKSVAEGEGEITLREADSILKNFLSTL